MAWTLWAGGAWRLGLIFGRFLATAPLGLSSRVGSSGGEDTAKPEMMLKCESLVGIYIAWRQRIHHSHVSEIGAAAGRGKNCALSRNSVLKTALPDQHGAVKLNATANIRLARYFSPSLLSEDINPDPQKAFTIPGGDLTCRSAALSDLRRGGNSFASHLCPNFRSGFTSHIGKLQVEVGRGFPSPCCRAWVRRYKGLFGTRGENCTLPLARTLLLPPRSRQRWWIQLQIFVKEGLELHTSWTWVKGTRVSIFRAFLIQFWIFAWE